MTAIKPYLRLPRSLHFPRCSCPCVKNLNLGLAYLLNARETASATLLEREDDCSHLAIILFAAELSWKLFP